MSKVHDLILIRHEEAEGNVAMVKSKFRGDESLFTPEFRKKPSDTWHLTDRGRERCKAIRGWLEKRVPIGDKFRLITSPSVRAVETANLILPASAWEENRLVRGRSWGGIECIPWSEWPEFCKSHGMTLFLLDFIRPIRTEKHWPKSGKGQESLSTLLMKIL